MARNRARRERVVPVWCPASCGLKKREQAVADDPTHQFQIQKIVPIEIGGIDFSFTNASLFMVASAAVAASFPLFRDVQSQRSFPAARSHSRKCPMSSSPRC